MQQNWSGQNLLPRHCYLITEGMEKRPDVWYGWSCTNESTLVFVFQIQFWNLPTFWFPAGGPFSTISMLNIHRIPILNPQPNLNPIHPCNHPKHLMGSKSLAAPFIEGWPWGNCPSAVPQSNRFTSKSGRVRIPSPTLEVLGRSNWYTSLLRTLANVGWPKASWNSTNFVLCHPADYVRVFLWCQTVPVWNSIFWLHRSNEHNALPSLPITTSLQSETSDCICFSPR